MKTRWWEDYLPRYLMPSLAGMVIVSWLSSVPNAEFSQLLFFFRPFPEKIDAASLVFLFLYGNLFCYLSSLPVLCFHVTRALDGPQPRGFYYPYLITVAIGLCSLLWTKCFSEYAFYLAFLVVLLFVGIQMWWLWQVTRRDGNTGKSHAYTYSLDLAKCRGIREDFVQERSFWRREFIETYRHMREYGNSAFIFVLELVLASLCLAIVSQAGYVAHQQLSLLGILLGLWALPSMFVHWLGQHLEREFSG